MATTAMFIMNHKTIKCFIVMFNQLLNNIEQYIIRLFICDFMYTIFDVINHRIVLKYTLHDFSYDFFDSNVFIFHLRTNMDSDEEVAAAAMIVAICVENDERKKTRKRRKVWVKPWLQKRKSHGFYSQLLNELRLEDFEMYKNYLRMKPQNFHEILHFVRYKISPLIYESLWRQRSNLR